jgi:phosphoglucosamine mutase
MKRLFGTDGVRGVVGEGLTPELALSIGKALGIVLRSDTAKSRPKIIIGADTRNSSDMLASAVAAGLTSVGCNCYMLGTVPTPAVAYVITESGAKAGVMISASHNPYQYNGIKIFDAEGFKLSDELEEDIETLIS